MDGQGPPGPPHMFGGPRGFDGPPDGDPFFDRPPFDQPPRGFDDSGFHGPRRGEGGPPRGGRGGGRFGWRGGPPRGMPPGGGGPPPHLMDEDQQQLPSKRMRMEEKSGGNNNNISNINSSTTGKSEESSEKETKVERSRRSRWSNASPEPQDIVPLPLNDVKAPVEPKPDPSTETCPTIKEDIASSEPEPESSEAIKSEC